MKGSDPRYLNNASMKRLSITVLSSILVLSVFFGQQIPKPALVGYWENWGNLKLTEVHDNYNVIQLAFATTKGSSLYNMEFNLPYHYSKTAFIRDAQELQRNGKVVILSMGGQADPIRLDNQNAYDGFITSMKQIMQDYEFVFDGIDIDFEGESMDFGYWTMNAPAKGQVYLVQAMRELQTYFQENTNKRMMLTMAPETVYLVGALSQWQLNNTNGGAMLPIIDEMLDEIDLLHPQFYNATESVAIDGRTYQDDGSSSYMVAISESILQGFALKGGKGYFAGFPEEKFAIGLPAGICSAGSGYVVPEKMEVAIDYLRGKLDKPEDISYSLKSNYPNLAGLMTWSINGDYKNSCSGSWVFAESFKKAFPEEIETSITTPEGFSVGSIYPNPTNGELHFSDFEPFSEVTIFYDTGVIVASVALNESAEFDLSSYPSGTYILEIGNQYYRIVKY